MKHKYLIASFLFTTFCAPGLLAQCGPSMVTTTVGDTVVYTCPGDGMADIILLANSAEALEMFSYIVTDDQNMILEVPGDVPMIDVEGAGPGICRVWGLTYTGVLTAEMGMDLMDDDLATGCSQLSDNFITLYRDMPEAGAVSVVGGGTTTTVITGDGIADVVMFQSNTTSLSNYAWIITDEDGMILGVEFEPMHDFEDAGGGVCLVYGVSFTGELNAPMGMDVTMVEFSEECYDLSSNYITVDRLSVGILDAPRIGALRIYPTVVTDQLIIELDQAPLSGTSIQVNDLQGRLVQEIPVAMANERLVISADAFAPGQYTCTLLTSEGRAVGRFIKE